MQTTASMTTSHRFATACLALATAFASGCAGESGGAADPPDLDSADSADSADGDCRIVLDHVAGPESEKGDPGCDPATSTCNWIHHIDVRKDVFSEPVTVNVLVSRNGGDWTEKRAVASNETSSDRDGYSRFVVHDFITAAGGVPGDLRIELIPFLRNEETQDRVFDHNRNATENYLLDASNGWTIAADESCR
jgi:hypothetical protein